MKEKRQIPHNRILLSFLIATFIFVNIFLIGYGVSYAKTRSIAQVQEETYFNLLNSQLENKLKLSSCESFLPYQISGELNAMGGLLNILEEKFGRQDSRVIKQKKIYSMLELQHYFLVKDYNIECNGDFPLVMFFYSNNQNFIETAERQGFILSNLKKQNANVMIYSFDYDLDFNIIDSLKKEYRIIAPNTVLVNEETKIKNLQNIEELREYLE